jgi:hypothetical protein
MSENATGDFTVDNVQATTAGNGQQPQQQQLPIELSPEESVRSNPAWDGLLSRVPSGLHPMITPELAKWDKNFQEVQTKYSPYKPYLDNGIAPESINQALGLMQLAIQNPRLLHDQMIAQYGEEWGLNAPVQGQQEDNNTFDLGDQNLDAPQQFDIENHPYVQELKKNLDTVAQYLAGQLEQESQQKYDQELDEQITTLQQSKGSFDEQTVLSYAAQGMPLEDAVDLYHQKFGQQQQSRVNRPSIMPTGGGVPSQQVDVTALSGKDTRGLVAHLIEQINGNNSS